MKKLKNWTQRLSLTLILLACADSAISEEGNELCVCEDENNIILVQNVSEKDYLRLEKYENDLLCVLFASNRVDDRFKIDVAMCTRDENT